MGRQKRGATQLHSYKLPQISDKGETPDSSSECSGNGKRTLPCLLAPTADSLKG